MKRIKTVCYFVMLFVFISTYGYTEVYNVSNLNISQKESLFKKLEQGGNLTPQEIELIKNSEELQKLNPFQRDLILKKLEQGGGSLTPEEIELIKKSGVYESIKEFQGVSPFQKDIIIKKLEQGGGNLTPDEIEIIKKSLELQNINPLTKNFIIKKLEQGSAKLTSEEIELIKKSLGIELHAKKLFLEELELGKKKKREKTLESKFISEKERIYSIFKKYLEEKTGELTVSTDIKPFGYNLFEQSVLKPIPAQPVAPDYIIGPGDEIQVLFWGRLNAQHTLLVESDGRILFPQIGPLTVAGMTYEEMKNFLTKQAERITGTNVAITLSRLRQIQVFVLGEVKNPGPYNLNAMSTILDSLIAAGGPTERGSMRKIILKRNNKVVCKLDLYDLLLKGDKKNDKRLRHGDTIFVPLVGPLVGIAGNVRRPAIYELKDEKTLDQALKLAGDLLPIGWKQKIQIERPDKHKWKVILDVNAEDKINLKKFKLRDGDLIKVFSIIPDKMNSIELIGNVRRPGSYSYHKGMKLSEIITSVDDLLPDTYFDYALIKRYIWSTGETKLVPFNLGKVVLEKQKDVELKPWDKIYIFSKWFFQSEPSATIKGEVRNPGTYKFKEKEFRVKDLILLAGGLTKEAYLEKAEIVRLDKINHKRKLITFNLKKALMGDPKENILLKDMDEIIIHSIWEYIPKQTVTIYGEVNNPGEYPYVPNMRVKDLVFAGGNIKESAYLSEAEISSYEIIDGKLSLVSVRKIDLGKALKGDPENNVILKPYDKLFVKKISDWGMAEYVEIQGEVMFPGRYVIKKGEKLSSLIERAGGFTADAYLYGAKFYNKQAKAIQRKSIDDLIRTLELRAQVSLAQAMQTSVSSEETQSYKLAQTSIQNFIDKLKKVEPEGRVSIKLTELSSFKNSKYDFPLTDGDVIVIPKRPEFVSVVGSVYTPTAFLYEPGKTVGDYIKQAGGITKNADKDHIYVLKANGEVYSKKQAGILNNFYSYKPMPGDTIVVPEDFERIPYLRLIKDISDIVFKIATTAGVAIAAL